MNLHLLIPSLFWPEPAFSSVYQDLSLPALENLLGKCSIANDESEGMEAWLCRAFGAAKQQDWPVAPVTLKIDGTKDTEAETGYWIRADPVHLHIEHEQIVLADSRVFQISSQEADQFTALLNGHFAMAGLEVEFLPLQSDRWYLRATNLPPTQTHLLGEVANRGINELLPSGANNNIWRNLFNEVQMVLHEHPLNQLREARGQPPVNATWFWGGGVMPENLSSPYTHVWSNDALSSSLALACGTDYAQLPEDATKWQHLPIAGNHLAVLAALHGQAQYGDAYGWRESLKELERSWFVPIWAMSRKGWFDQLTVTALGERSSKTFTAKRVEFRKFCRRTKPLSTYKV
jgi:hypothetical protein